MTAVAPTSTFPRRYAATQRFSLGAPRSFSVAPDGSKVVFVRSRAGDDPVGCLWVLDPQTGEERCVADPRTLGADDAAELPPEERARRERTRESAGGIVTYATDRAFTRAVFALGAAAFVVHLDTAAFTPVAAGGPVIAPRLSPDGQHLAFVRDRSLWVAEPNGAKARCVARADSPTVSWGLPDFIAAEEMDRYRGYWWAPDSLRLAVARVDEAPVQQWYIGDPIDPGVAPTPHRYPAAGTPNADVSLHVIELTGSVTDVSWDRAAFPYLADVGWRRDQPLLVTVQSRDQQRLQVLTVDDAGATSVAGEEARTPWVELVPGFPQRTADGRSIHPLDEPETRRIGISGEPITPQGLNVRRLIQATDDRLVFSASADDPTAVAVYSCGLDGSGLQPLTPTDGVADCVIGGDVSVIIERRLDRFGATATVIGGTRTTVASHAEQSDLTLNATELVLGPNRLRAMLLLPHGYDGTAPLPVLLDPYGGPHAQRVLRSHDAHLQSQWFADAGFAVLVIDGRGSPGRGPAWEQSLAGDLGTLPLQDQVDGLMACAQARPGVLDLDRVAIKGWSFGGYLAALAVLRRPDIFSAAIAGAPVADWSLYDTHYTERYLGQPSSDAAAYEGSSVLNEAQHLQRPLLIIHGLSDDNVVAAHTLRLSRALLEAGRPHTVLPLSGVTHMTPQEVVAENLLHLQLHFLQTSLGLPTREANTPAS